MTLTYPNRRRVLMIVLVLAVVLIGVPVAEAVARAVIPPLVGEYWCDGSVEGWQLPGDYRGGGCAQITPAWHRVFPWNWHDTELVCLGLCTDLAESAPDP